MLIFKSESEQEEESKTANLVQAVNSSYSGDVCEFAPAGSIEVISILILFMKMYISSITLN